MIFLTDIFILFKSGLFRKFYGHGVSGRTCAGILLFLLLPAAALAGEFESLVLDHKPQAYKAPLFLKVLTVYDGKLYYEISGETPTPKSALYKGIIKLHSPKTYILRFLYENSLGEEKYFGPFVYELTPPRGFSQKLPVPSIPGGIYDSVLTVKFELLKKGDIYYGLDGPSNLKKYSGEDIKITGSSKLFYKAVYDDKISTDLFTEAYEILIGAPKVSLKTGQREFNYEPKLAVKLQNADKAFFSLDPLAPHSSFQMVVEFIPVQEGNHILRLFAKNPAGTESEEVKYSLTVDKTPPRVKYYVNSSDRTINLSSNEPAVIYYTIDGSIPSKTSPEYISPIPLPRDGTVPLKFFAVDALGNESQLIWFKASVDTQPPKVRPSHKSGAYASPIQLKFECSEACVIRYSLDGSDPVLSRRTLDGSKDFIDIKKEGPTVVKYLAKDENGNATKTYTSRYIIDTQPPIVRFKLIQTTEQKGLGIEFITNEQADIYYTIDGSTPSLSSKQYEKGLTIQSGTNFKFIAVDTLKNQTDVRVLKEILKKTVLVSPPGGVYNKGQTIFLESIEGKNIKWKVFRNGRPVEGDEFKPYTGPIPMNYEGSYALSFYVDEQDSVKNIQEQMYIIDKSPPQIVPFLEKSAADTIFYLVFETNEPAKIFYTLDGSIPTPANSFTIGSEFQNLNLRIRIRRFGKQVLRYYGIDRAENRSAFYQLDLFSPYVTTQPPPGEYHSIISLKLASQKGNTIYYGRDSLTLSLKSSVYDKPILIKSSQEIWFFAVDITGFAGPRQKASFVLNFPPQPQFSVSREKVIVNDEVLLDGKLSADEETPLEKLLFRWDLDGDGNFDTPFRSVPHITARFKHPGAQYVTLEVMDSDSLTGSIREKISVHKACPSDMVSVTTDDAGFCIDKYEWPNREGGLPLSNVNWAEASMLCIEKGKRLCSISEWKISCQGKFEYFFSYGNTYIPDVCNTESETARASSSKSGCRSSEDIYDQVGNLWEWASDINEGRHYILGGSYEQSSASSCGLSFPSQIGVKSPSIGFRCCQ